jgi:hypothetical protein
MPVRSLSSSVLKWPDVQTVDLAVRRWANTLLNTEQTSSGSATLVLMREGIGEWEATST